MCVSFDFFRILSHNVGGLAEEEGRENITLDKLYDLMRDHGTYRREFHRIDLHSHHSRRPAKIYGN